MKILLLRPDRAGDAIKTLPAIRSLRAKFPNHSLHILASEHNFSIFEFEPHLTSHIIPAHWKRMKGETLRQFFQSLPGPFDVVINLLCDPSEGMTKLLHSIPGKKICSVRQNEEMQLHITPLELPENTPAGRDESLNIAELISQALTVDIRPLIATISRAPLLTDYDREEATEKMGTKNGAWLGFCPLASLKQRSHPLKRWEKLISKATQHEEYEKIFLFGTPSDYPFLQQIREAAHRKEIVECCFPSSFRSLGAYLNRLDGLVAVDSGPLHLGLALGVKSLGILSGGDSDRWFPHLKEGDELVKRGILQRFPSHFEMIWAFEKWSSKLLSTKPAPGLASDLTLSA